MFSKLGGRFDTEFYLTHFLFYKKSIFYIQCKNVTNNSQIDIHEKSKRRE